QLLDDIDKAITSFKNLSRTRNFYCHATYRYDSELNLRSASGVTVTQDGAPLAFTEKKMELAALNEMSHITIELGTLNRGLWKLVERLQKELGVQRVTPPSLPPEPK